jgi:type II secretory pathway component GspD/PulD (secretin)
MEGKMKIFIFAILILSISFSQEIFPEQNIKFTYSNVDIQTVLEDFGRVIGWTIINNEIQPATEIDPLSGRPTPGKKIAPARFPVTIKSEGLISVNKAFQIIQLVLEENGYTIVVHEKKKTLEVLHVKAAIQSPDLKIFIGNDPEKVPEGAEVVKQIVFLRNLRAVQIRTDIQTLLPAGALVTANEPANALIIVASLSTIKHILSIIKTLDEASMTVAEIKIFQLKYANAEKLADVLRKVFQEQIPRAVIVQAAEAPPTQPPTRPTQPTRIPIIEDKTTNSIVVMATKELLPIVEKAINDLDKRPSQVMVETLIVEVALTGNLRYGVEWIFRQGLEPGKYSPQGDILIKTPETTETERARRYFFQLTTEKLTAILTFLKEHTDVNIVSRPRIFTLENQEAIVRAGSRIPYVERTVGQGGQVLENVKFEDVELLLKVRPQINEDKQINMAITQQVASQIGTAPNGAPIIDRRTTETNALVKDGQSIILGGVIRTEKRLIENKVPILGDIPLLGFLFKSAEYVDQKTELIVVLTPHVVSELEEAEKLKEEKDKKTIKEGEQKIK